VQAVAYSKNGALLAAAGNGGLQILSASSHALIRCLPTGANYSICSVALSSDGQTLACCGQSLEGSTSNPIPQGTLQLWNLQTGKLIQNLATANNYAVNSVAFSPDSNTLAVGGIDTNLHTHLELWQVSTRSLETSLPTGATQSIGSIEFSPDGLNLAVGGNEHSFLPDFKGGLIELWNRFSGTLSLSIKTGSASTIRCLAFSPDGKSLCTAASGEPVHLWNIVTGQNTESFQVPSQFTVSSLAFAPNGKMIAGAESDPYSSIGGCVELWDVPTAAVLASLHSSGVVQRFAVAFSPDGKTVADGGQGTIEFWDVATHDLKSAGGTLLTLASVSLSTDGTKLAVGGSISSSDDIQPSGSSLGLWSVASGTLKTRFPTAIYRGVGCVALSPDGSLLAAGGTDKVGGGRLELWSTSTNKLLFFLKTSATGPIRSVAFSPDGKTLASGSSRSGGLAELWNVSSGALLKTFSDPSVTGITCISFTPDGQKLATGTYSGLYLWSIATGEILTKFQTGTNFDSFNLAFSPDGKTLAVAENDSVELWNTANGKLLTTLSLRPNSYSVSSVAFTPDGKVLFVGTQASLQAFSTSGYGLLKWFNANLAGWVYSIRVPGNGALLAYGCGDGTIVVAPNPFYALGP
jgi:WD40 repeat protein